MMNIVHVTHEAVHKIGGIGAVLEGLITAPDYARAVGRTVLLCPLFNSDGDMKGRLGPSGEVAYSSMDGKTDHALAPAFREIQDRYRVGLVYGHRRFCDPMSALTQRVEVVLVDVSQMAPEAVNAFKARLHESFGIVSSRYEQSWDYEQYVRLALPGLDVVSALGAASGEEDCVVVAHEFMGVPTALAAKLQPERGVKTVYYAHEVPPIRKIVEEHPAHDAMFYNVLRESAEQGLHIEDVFGDQFGYFRHALAEAARHLDVTLAVGDYVEQELRFLSPAMARADIRLAYNGIPARRITLEDATTSKRRLQDYIEALLGHRPDHVFTHVTRMAPSKGLWRDLLVLEHIEQQFRREDRTAVLIVLSTEIGGPRERGDILHMEKWWDWPVAHREGGLDLSGGEALFYAGVQAFNAWSRNCKVLYINQFGFDRESCGDRMPEEMDFWDIRKGSDLEFGQSIYEPFGIAQVEALSFGAICVMSSVCGCAPFASKAAGPEGAPNVIIGDYTDVEDAPDTIDGYRKLTRSERGAFDKVVAGRVAREILEHLPRAPEQKAALVERGYELACKMGWNVIARDRFLPAVRDITSHCVTTRTA